MWTALKYVFIVLGILWGVNAAIGTVLAICNPSPNLFLRVVFGWLFFAAACKIVCVSNKKIKVLKINE